jgi:hypothetical protein
MHSKRVPQERNDEDGPSSECVRLPSSRDLSLPSCETQCARQDSNLKPPDP